MKKRLGFVSNSSGSSFVCDLYLPSFLTWDDFLSMIKNPDQIITDNCKDEDSFDDHFDSETEEWDLVGIKKELKPFFEELKKKGGSFYDEEPGDWMAWNVLESLINETKLMTNYKTVETSSGYTTTVSIVKSDPLKMLPENLLKKYIKAGHIKLESPNLGFLFFLNKQFKNWDEDSYDWKFSEHLPTFCEEYKSIWGPSYIIKTLSKKPEEEDK